MDRTEDLRARIEEFIRDATKISDHGQEALRHLAAGDLQAACDVIGISHYPIGQVRGDYDGILEILEAQGITPGGSD